jgi:hypothetical protein
MTNVEPSLVLYALLLDPGCCLRAHITLIELVEPEGKKKISLTPVSWRHANANLLTPPGFLAFDPAGFLALLQWGRG